MRRPLTLAVFFLQALLLAQTVPPDRTVHANILTSDHDPGVRITLPGDVQYVGAERFILYGIADCELHVFVAADTDKRVRRLYWIQFEGYLPSKPDLHHQYDSPRHAVLGGWDFYVDSWVRAKDEPSRSGSDREHVTELLRAKGFKMPAGTMDVRLVHLLDDQKRNELMIIYAEDLSPTGLKPADLKEGVPSYSRWPEMTAGLASRAQQQIKIEPLSPP